MAEATKIAQAQQDLETKSKNEMDEAMKEKEEITGDISRKASDMVRNARENNIPLESLIAGMDPNSALARAIISTAGIKIAAPVVEGPKITITGTTIKIDKARGEQIAANVQEGYKNNKALFVDQATFKKAYGYDSKPMEEQVLLNAIWKKLVDDGKIASIKPSTTSSSSVSTPSTTPAKTTTSAPTSTAASPVKTTTAPVASASAVPAAKTYPYNGKSYTEAQMQEAMLK